MACAAPPMSFFMRRMPSWLLMSSPPESKHTPLPTMAMRGCFLLAPADFEQARGARRGPSHGVDRREVRGEELITHPFVELAAEELGLLAHDVGELLGTHVLRGCVHQVAHQAHRLRHVERFLHARRVLSSTWSSAAARFCLLVARELVGAQVPREGRLVGRHGDRALAERIAPRARKPGEEAAAKDHESSASRTPASTRATPPCASGSSAERVRRAVEARGASPLALGGGKRIQEPSQGLLRPWRGSGLRPCRRSLLVGDDGHAAIFSRPLHWR